jgi:membrane protease YdiL (CAAX protease family)
VKVKNFSSKGETKIIIKITNPFQSSYKLCWVLSICCLLIEIAKKAGRVQRGQWGSLQKYYDASPFLFFVWLCLIAPLWEETVFRWLIIKKIGKGKFFFILTSFFSFIMIHFIKETFTLGRFLNLSYYSAWIIFIYWLSDWNLLFPIFLHFLVNFTYFCFKV